MAAFDPDVFGGSPGFDPDVFAAPKASKIAKPQQAPVEDPGFWKSALIGAGKTTDSIVKGMQQLYLTAKDDQAGLDKLRQQVEGDREVYKRLQEIRPVATGLGEAAPSMAVPFGAGSTLLGTAGRMFAAGAVPAALEYGTAGERAGRAAVAGVAGAAVPIGVAGAKTAWSLAEPLYEGGRQAIAARTLQRVAGADAPQVAQRLMSAQPVVPGSMPTAAQVAENGGIAALERSASSAFPTPFADRWMQQASARVSALRDIAKDKAALQAAEAARDSASRGLYAQADAATVIADADLKKLLARMPGGHHKGVVQDAMELARISGEPLKVGKDVPASFVAATDASGAPILQDVPEKAAEYSGRALHYIKLALDNAISKSGDGAMGDAMKRASTGLKKDYLAYLDNAIPAYGQARAKFTELSKPVNQMEVGQELLNKVQPALADWGALGSETGATYGRALRDADATAARVLGFDGATMASVMTPQQMQTINAVATDLARKSTAQNLGRGVGSNTFQNLAMQNIAEQSGMPRLAGGLLNLPGVHRATNWVYRDTDKQIQGLLADALLDPQIAGGLLSKSERKLLENSPKARKALEQAAIRSGGLLGLSLVD